MPKVQNHFDAIYNPVRCHHCLGAVPSGTCSDSRVLERDEAMTAIRPTATLP